MRKNTPHSWSTATGITHRRYLTFFRGILPRIPYNAQKESLGLLISRFSFTIRRRKKPLDQSDHSPRNATGSNLRAWERHFYAKQLELHLADQVLTGTSRDVSLGGLFLVTGHASPPSSVNGLRGTLYLRGGEGSPQALPCTVIRVAEDGLALRLDESQALFGWSIAAEIFSEIKRQPRPARTRKGN